jgi:hypothetical protein
VFLFKKYIEILYFLFFKIYFDTNTSKRSKNIKNNLKQKKTQNFSLYQNKLYGRMLKKKLNTNYGVKHY